MNKSNVYEPEEDTFLLLSVLNKELTRKENLKICEVGVGSGEILFNLEKNHSKNNYFGSDINEDAIVMTQVKVNKANLKKGNLLEPFDTNFDVIYFNTPYLPCEDNESYEKLSLKDKAIYGGKQGYEIIEQFILQVNDKLENNGEVFILYSSLSKPEYIEKLLDDLCFNFEIIATKKVSFEELIVIKINKKDILKEITKKGASKIKYLDSGKHSKVLEGDYKNKEVIIKIGKDQHISKEALFMKKLKGEEFCPRFDFAGEGYVVREKLKGEQIRYWIEKSGGKETFNVLQKVMDFCFRLDILGINKFEMTNPYKHIFIDKNLKCKMIDFERCIFTEDPKNTTQFLQYIKRNIPLFEKKDLKFNGNKILDVGKKYSKDKNKFDLKELMN